VLLIFSFSQLIKAISGNYFPIMDHYRPAPWSNGFVTTGMVKALLHSVALLFVCANTFLWPRKGVIDYGFKP
jgi:hypothetical protein